MTEWQTDIAWFVFVMCGFYSETGWNISFVSSLIWLPQIKLLASFVELLNHRQSLRNWRAIQGIQVYSH